MDLHEAIRRKFDQLEPTYQALEMDVVRGWEYEAFLLGRLLTGLKELRGVQKTHRDDRYPKDLRRADGDLLDDVDRRLRALLASHPRQMTRKALWELEHATDRLLARSTPSVRGDPLENADTLDTRGIAHEVLLLLRSLDVDTAVYEARLETFDARLLAGARDLLEEGFARDPFWMEHAPEDHWWWRLGETVRR